MSRDQNAGRSHNIKTDNSSFERVEQFKYLGRTLTSQSSVQEQNYEQVEVKESLLLFGAESSIFQFAIHKYKVLDIQNYNFTFCFCMGVKLGRSR
jgi:hypothetical protein